MPKKRKTKTVRRQKPKPVITMPSTDIYPIQRVPAASREEQLRDWFDFQFKQIRDRVDRLETSSVGEFATLLDSLRQQVRAIETNELARVTEINRLGKSAVEAARGRVDDVVTTVSQEFVSHDYLHSWISRINGALDEMRVLIKKITPTPVE